MPAASTSAWTAKPCSRTASRKCPTPCSSASANGLALDDLHVLVPHQANLRMLDAIVARVGVLPPEIYVNVEEYGNIASASLPIALHESRKLGLIRPGDACPTGGLWVRASLWAPRYFERNKPSCRAAPKPNRLILPEAVLGR